MDTKSHDIAHYKTRFKVFVTTFNVDSKIMLISRHLRTFVFVVFAVVLILLLLLLLMMTISMMMMMMTMKLIMTGNEDDVVFLIQWKEYSQLSLSGHLSKADTSVRRTENLVPAEFHLFLCN